MKLSKEQKELVELCIKQCVDTSNLVSKLEEVIGLEVGGPLFNHLHKQNDSLIYIVSKHIGDDNFWLDWFINENGCGSKGLEVRLSSRSKLRAIKTIKDLFNVI